MTTTRIRLTAPALWVTALTLLMASESQGQAQGSEAGSPSATPRATAAPTTSQARAPIHATHEERPTARAVRITDPITIDGRLDEAAWMTATPVTDFWQVDPDEGAPVSEPTEVRFLYDDDAIYVGAWLWDNDGQIIGRLSRRDTGISDVDLFSVHFDSYHDHRTSYRFTTSVSGTVRDQAASGGGGGLASGDPGYNPVWDVRTTVTPEGWYLEMRVPFSQLRFSRDEEQVWGLQIERKLRPQQENTVWVFQPKRQPQGQITFGHLTGIRGIRPGKRLELLPYAGGSAEFIAAPRRAGVAFDNPFRSGSDYFGSAGLDLKYRITSNLTLDGTVNPDFGQVELDPAVINLTAFETRFQERRPFFVEGAEIFQFGEDAAQILYSRRIGRPPRGSAPNAAVYDLTPATTTILGAAKVTGKTANGWSLALLDAVTGREQASWRDGQNAENELEVEPLTNYLAARARRELRAGQTALGGLVTAVHRELSGSPLEGSLLASAYSGGVDFVHDFADRAWHLSASASPSLVTGSTGALIATQRTSSRYYQRPDADYLGVDSTATSLFGYTARAALAKQDGLWRLRTAASVISPGYEINDLGFSTNSDRIDASASFGYEQTVPGPLVRNWNLYLSPDAAWNYGGDVIGATATASGQAQLPNFATVSGRLAYNPSKLNPRLTRGGPLTRDPVGYSGSLSYNTSNQNRLVWRLGTDFGGDRSGAWARSVNASVNFRVGEKLDVSLGPSLERSLSRAQYVTSVSDPLATRTFGRRYVFADLDQTTFSVDTRVNVTLSPRTTIEIFAQPLLGSGDYGTPKELRRPRSFEFDRYGIETGTMAPTDGGARFQVDPDGSGPASPFRLDNRDFNERSLRANAVFRWEWRPGSTLFLVWQHNRDGRLDWSDPNGQGARVGNFDFGRDTGDLFGLDSDNILLIKASYWLNP